MAAARALARAAVEKACAAARLGPNLRAPQSSILRHDRCPPTHSPTSKFTPRASQPSSPTRVPLLVPPSPPRVRVPPMRSGALHFSRVAFSTKGDSSAADAGGHLGRIAKDCGDVSLTDAAKEADASGSKDHLGDIGEEADAICRTEAAKKADAGGSHTEAAKEAHAASTDEAFFKRLTKFIEKHSEEKEIRDRVSRRNQTFFILIGVICEITVIVLVTVVAAGPMIVEYVKRKTHEAIKEDSTRESIWHALDNVFSYFGHKLSSPVIMAARGVAVAGKTIRDGGIKIGNTIKKGGRKVGVWFHVVKEEVPEVPEDKEEAALMRSMEGSNLKGLVDGETVTKTGKAAGIGLVFGIVCGAINSLLHDGPQVGSNVKYPQLIRTTKVCGHYAVYLAVTGATFVGVEQALARYRMKKGIVNGAAAGFASGAVLGFRVGSFRMAFFSGSALALTSVLLDVTGMKSEF